MRVHAAGLNPAEARGAHVIGTEGRLRPVIAATFPLADAAKAHELGDTGHVAGKLVLTMR